MKKFFMTLLFFAGIGVLAYFLWQRQAEEESYVAAPEFKAAETPRASAVGE